MVPLYLPLTLDEADQSAGVPVFFNGINVYLDQRAAWFRKAPGWLHHLVGSPRLLKWAARLSSHTRADTLGPLTLSMLRGEAGNQARELEDLISWLQTQPKPDAVFLSNALLLGMARRLKSALGRPVICMLQGEDYFLDSLPEPDRSACWAEMAQRAQDADLFMAPSRYFAELMQRRMSLASDRVRVVYNGINLDGYSQKPSGVTSSANDRPAPVLGYLARMCREKGLDTLVEAFILLRRRGRVPNLKLSVAGSFGPADESFVHSMKHRIEAAKLTSEVEFHPNVDRVTKLKLLASFSIFSVPARYGEAFGLYVIEALAAGVPVVQPRTAAFPELVEMTGAGILTEPENPEELADAIESLLLDAPRARALAESGRKAAFEKFSAEAMAREVIAAVKSIDECLAKG
jgi:glycosyltransferase involved in cell wall biosynthesis